MSEQLLVELRTELTDPRPVSINKLYSGSAGRRFLTAEGKRFKAALTAKVAQATATLGVPWTQVVQAIYANGGFVDLRVDLYLERLHNASWRVGGSLTKPKDGKKPQPRSPYQKVDATNYIKLIEDAVAAGTGIDDSANLGVAIRKHEDKLRPRVVVHYRIYE